MISRQWRGIARREEASNYVNHLRSETFPRLSKIPGFLKASILRRDTEQGVEFLIITEWESIEAIRAFAGAAEDVAVVPPVVESMMVDYERNVRHYEVIESYVP